MAFEYVSTGLTMTPSAAAGNGIAGPGSAWTSTAWSQLIASTATAIILAGVTAKQLTGVEMEIDIGVGGAGSEVVVGTLRTADQNTNFAPYILPFPLPISGIGSGQRVSWRLRLGSSSTSTVNLTLLYYATGSIATATVTAKPSKVYPSAADGIALNNASAAAWTNTAWAELVASTAAAIVVAGLIVRPIVSSFDWEVDLGIGIAGAEVVLTTFRGHTFLVGGAVGPQFFPHIPMFDAIPSGSRLAVRFRKSAVNSGDNRVALLYYEKPL